MVKNAFDDEFEDDDDIDPEIDAPSPDHDEPLPISTAEAVPVPGAHEDQQEAVAEYYFEEVEDGDHRVAQLRKMRHQFVRDGELTLPNNMLTMEDSGPALIVCPNCNSEEVQGLKFCTQCNARLPNIIVAQQKYNPGSIDQAARKYYDVVNDFHAETMSLDDFVDFLTKGLEKVRAHAETLADLSADGVISDWLPEASALISNATQLWYDSVESMLVRVEDCQVEYEDEEALLEELEEEDRGKLVPLEDRIRMLDFTPELESIFRSNDQMLEYLRILDTNLKVEAKSGGMQF